MLISVWAVVVCFVCDEVSHLWTMLDVGCVSPAWVVKGLLPVLCIMHWRVWAVQRHCCISLERLLRASGAVGGEMHQVFCGPEQNEHEITLGLLSLSESSCPLRDTFSSISLHVSVNIRLICLAHFHSVSLVLSTSYPYLLNQKWFSPSQGNVESKEEKRGQWESSSYPLPFNTRCQLMSKNLNEPRPTEVELEWLEME